MEKNIKLHNGKLRVVLSRNIDLKYPYFLPHSPRKLQVNPFYANGKANDENTPTNVGCPVVDLTVKNDHEKTRPCSVEIFKYRPRSCQSSPIKTESVVAVVSKNTDQSNGNFDNAKKKVNNRRTINDNIDITLTTVLMEKIKKLPRCSVKIGKLKTNCVIDGQGKICPGSAPILRESKTDSGKIEKFNKCTENNEKMETRSRVLKSTDKKTSTSSPESKVVVNRDADSPNNEIEPMPRKRGRPKKNLTSKIDDKKVKISRRHTTGFEELTSFLPNPLSIKKEPDFDKNVVSRPRTRSWAALSIKQEPEIISSKSPKKANKIVNPQKNGINDINNAPKKRVSPKKSPPKKIQNLQQNTPNFESSRVLRNSIKKEPLLDETLVKKPNKVGRPKKNSTPKDTTKMILGQFIQCGPEVEGLKTDSEDSPPIKAEPTFPQSIKSTVNDTPPDKIFKVDNKPKKKLVRQRKVTFLDSSKEKIGTIKEDQISSVEINNDDSQNIENQGAQGVIPDLESNRKRRWINVGTARITLASMLWDDNIQNNESQNHLPKLPHQECNFAIEEKSLPTCPKTVNHEEMVECNLCEKIILQLELCEHEKVCEGNQILRFPCSLEGCEETFQTQQEEHEHRENEHVQLTPCTDVNCVTFSHYVDCNLNLNEGLNSIDYINSIIDKQLNAMKVANDEPVGTVTKLFERSAQHRKNYAKKNKPLLPYDQEYIAELFSNSASTKFPCFDVHCSRSFKSILKRSNHMKIAHKNQSKKDLFTNMLCSWGKKKKKKNLEKKAGRKMKILGNFNLTS